PAQVFTTYSHCRQAQPTIKYQLLQAFKKPETAIFCSEEFWGIVERRMVGRLDTKKRESL
ncbi:MAG: hypothetical protein QW656_06625, partial [Zestosphaera sp.]